MKKYVIKEEKMCGEPYFMIYVKILWIIPVFFERWNTLDSATTRIKELNHNHKNKFNNVSYRLVDKNK